MPFPGLVKSATMPVVVVMMVLVLVVVLVVLMAYGSGAGDGGAGAGGGGVGACDDRDLTASCQMIQLRSNKHRTIVK